MLRFFLKEYNRIFKKIDKITEFKNKLLDFVKSRVF